MRVLLVGNGPAALAKEMGEVIDNFSGHVLRFNNYSITKYEKWVGTRTDIWVTCDRHVTPMSHQHKKRWFLSFRTDEKTQAAIADCRAEQFPLDYILKTVNAMNFNHPSSGAVVATYLLDQGHDVWIWGFDFLASRRDHHYNKDQIARGEFHSEDAEWFYFHRLMQEGKVKYLGMDRHKETIPNIRHPVECGRDDDISWYRESAHDGWYKFVGIDCKDKKVLDVGAGLCEGMKILEGFGANVDGFEVDPRLGHLHPNLIIGDSLDMFESKSYDIITCVDVIEHVVEDRVFMEHMKRIARELVFVTTPNYTRSKAGNHAHCREYTIAQFANHFQPSAVWSASPDGNVHHTLLLSRIDGWMIDYSPTGVQNKFDADIMPAYRLGMIPLTVRFNNTVDGEEWAHICGYFDM